jgi:hypothetical protein
VKAYVLVSSSFTGIPLDPLFFPVLNHLLPTHSPFSFFLQVADIQADLARVRAAELDASRRLKEMEGALATATANHTAERTKLEAQLDDLRRVSNLHIIYDQSATVPCSILRNSVILV